LRDLQSHFTPSKLFAPLLENERRKRVEQQQRRKRNPNEGQVKLGHGGTLDPLATGVLIVGVGKGTRQLSSFLSCTKTYETAILFGKSTDTYDIAGKIVASAPYEHVTRQLVEEKLSGFTGKIQQAPPIYSAIKINGMKAYDYARSGKELPRKLAPRDMEVTECKMLDWHEGGTHDYRWPAEEAPDDEKEAVRKLIHDTKTSDETVHGASRRRNTSPSDEDATEPEAKRPKTDSDLLDQPPTPKSTTPKASATSIPSDSTAIATEHIHAPPPSSTTPSPAPACTISLVVSSGFYVRSFAHDLGLACNSLGIMASLVRSRQGDFSLNPDADSAPYGVLSYADLALGEEHWGPKVAAMLEQWNSDHPVDSDHDERNPRIDGRDAYPPTRDRDRRQRGREHDRPKRFTAKQGLGVGSSRPDSGQRRERGHRHHANERRWERRNTSSGEE
jgi:tRNA pseudouridine55 synthase